jgi:tetratricopeptide (TPR) repeat protein
LEQLIDERRDWDNLARSAHWKSKFGEVNEADDLYAEAEDQLTVKQMRSFAWLEVQRGMLDFKRGRYADARVHYQRAEAGYPGYWHTSEHLAELLAAEQKFDEAISILVDVAASTGKPELLQTIGELYIVTARKDTAQPWLDKALAAYMDSVRLGGVHYFHHLADFYAGVGEDPAEAVRWARRDFELRSNFSTQSALAWALYRNSQVKEGLETIQLALSSGVQDAGIFSTAAELFEAAGKPDDAAHYRAAAFRLNPMHNNFHMHH